MKDIRSPIKGYTSEPGSVELIRLELRIMKLIISSFKRSENPKIFYNEQTL